MPRPLSEQTIVITGSSSGIGREAARRAGRRGARVVLAARNEAALEAAAGEVEQEGGRPHVEVTDMAEPDQVDRLADRAAARFGGIDTWVNCAGISAYGHFDDLAPEEIERVIRVDLLGPMHGARAALAHLRLRGGTLINVASVLGAQPAPFQAPYCAAKAGLIAFGRSLRMELDQEEDTDVHVTTILPPSVNTPFFDHARSRLGRAPKPMPPVYEPGVVADSIVFAAEHPRHEIAVGAVGRQLTLLGRVAPEVGGLLFSRRSIGFAQQTRDAPPDGGDALFDPSPSPAVRGRWGRASVPVSPYTRVFEHHPVPRPLGAAAGAMGRALSGMRRRG